MATILTKKSDTASSVPLAADLTNAAGGAELAVNTADKRVFSKTSGGTVVELGTNPSSMTLPNGTANGVAYLNGSKVLTSGSALTFDGSNFGIGTVSPDQRVHAYNTASNTWFRAQSGGDNSVGLYMTNSQRSWLWGVSGGGVGAMYLYDLTGSKEVLNISASGNLGLGVTPSAFASASKAIQVRQYIFEDNNNGYGIIRYNGFYNGTNDVYIQNGYATAYQTFNGQHRWYTAPSGTAGNAISFTQAMTLDASGNLLVGTTSTNASRVNINFAGASSQYGIGMKPAADNTFQLYFLNAAGSSVGQIYTTSSATSYNTSSDYRLKEDIQPMTGALAKVAALKPVTYKWKADGSDGQGFIAHELAEVCPDAVTGTKDAVDAEGKPVYQGIDVSFLVGTLTAAIQEQQAIIDAQQAALTALTARVAALESN